MKSVMYKILKMEGRAKRAHMETVHGNIETPVFMNVGTAAAIKGAVSTEDLQQIICAPPEWLHCQSYHDMRQAANQNGLFD